MTKSGVNNKLLEVDSLCLSISSNGRKSIILNDINFEIKKGECVALVGDSGSGKSMTALTILDLLPDYIQHESSGKIKFGSGSESVDLMQIKKQDWVKYRGKQISMIFQDPMNALNPIQRCGKQIAESIRLHKNSDKKKAKSLALELLDKVGLEDNNRFFRAYPHELSGGQLQRILIAIALAGEPDLLIADEPTTNLDADSKLEILNLINSIRNESGLALLYITHDLNEANQISDRILYMKDAMLIEENPFNLVEEQEVKRQLREGDDPMKSEQLIRVENLAKSFYKSTDFFSSKKTEIPVLKNVSFSIQKGRVTGLIGSSGSGKTTLGRVLLGLEKADRGKVNFAGKDILKLSGKALLNVRQKLQIVYQNPYNTLNPRMKIKNIVAEPLHIHQLLSDRIERRKKVEEMLERVGIPSNKFESYMYQLSGGQRQRVAIARALVLIPEFVVLDECVSSLDVNTQERILRLLMDLKEEFELSYLFISHDKDVVNRISDTVLILKNGELS